MVNALKHAGARRNHKERAQPLNRQRLGLLEKHKDYVHRARDYKSKQDRIKKLREKAAFKNKDEFYFGMVKGKTIRGVAVGDRGNEALGVDVVRLLKNQDLGYVRVQIAKDENKVEKLRKELEITAPAAGPSSEWSAAAELDEVEKLAAMGVILQPRDDVVSGRWKGKGKATGLPTGHVVFAEGRDEFNSMSSRPVTVDGEAETTEEIVDLGWAEPEKTGKKKKQAAVITAPPTSDIETEEDARAYRIELLTDLSAHLSRIRLLRQAEAKLEVTKSLMSKGGSARKIRNAGFVDDESAKEDKNGDKKRFEGKMWKWKLERRR